MNRERKAGLIFLGGCATLVVLVIVVFRASAAADLRYNVTFTSGKGLEVGDVAVLSGIAIGEVESVRLAGDRAVTVKLRIHDEHREKVQSNSTAYIANSTLPNVSGRMVVEIHNPSAPAGPMAPGTTIEGKNSWLELTAWRGASALQGWADSIGRAAGDLGEGAKNLTDGARKAIGEMGRGAAESARDGIVEGVEKGIDSGATALGDGIREGSEALGDAADDAAGKAGEAAGEALDGAAEGARDAVRSFDMKDAQRMTNELGALLGDLAKAGASAYEALLARWEVLKKDAVPMMESLRERGSELAARALQSALQSVEQAIEELRRQSEGGTGEPPSEAPLDAPRSSDAGGAVEI